MEKTASTLSAIAKVSLHIAWFECFPSEFRKIDEDSGPRCTTLVSWNAFSLPKRRGVMVQVRTADTSPQLRTPHDYPLPATHKLQAYIDVAPLHCPSWLQEADISGR